MYPPTFLIWGRRPHEDVPHHRRGQVGRVLAPGGAPPPFSNLSHSPFFLLSECSRQLVHPSPSPRHPSLHLALAPCPCTLHPSLHPLDPPRWTLLPWTLQVRQLVRNLNLEAVIRPVVIEVSPPSSNLSHSAFLQSSILASPFPPSSPPLPPSSPPPRRSSST